MKNSIFQRFARSRRHLFVLIASLACMASQCIGQAHTDKKAPSQYNHQRLLLRDEGLSQLSYEDLAHPANNWYQVVPAGRDMQLTGKGRVLIGTGNGYEERDIATGQKITELNSYPGTVAARRLRNGYTLLTGVNWQGKQGIVLLEVDTAGAVKKTIHYPGFDYVRLVRETTKGHFLVTADNTVFEGDEMGSIVWRATITGKDKSHAWQALRLANGHTIVSAGYAKNFQVFAADGSLLDSITGPAAVNPNFFAGFQVLPNGNFLVTNWQGHGPSFGASGTQVLEYTAAGKLAWSWKQDASKHSSLQGIILLDGLNTDLMYTENDKGILTAVKSAAQ